MCAKYVWAVVLWIAKLRGWQVESGDEDWAFGEGLQNGAKSNGSAHDVGVENDGKIWAVRTLERNWVRFMKLA
jgi:hypothetical protein